MKYYIISGEASGDLHGSNLIRHLIAKDPYAEIRFWGGDRMASAGGQMVRHYREITAMGFTEVLAKAGTILRSMKLCKSDILDFKPDVVIPVDFPGFNFRISKFAKENGIPVFYFIPPTVWAWKEWRIKKLTAFSTKIYTIFPFEPDYYKKKGIKVHYYGNPLLDSISEDKCMQESSEEFLRRNGLESKPFIALLAGSRHSEIDKLMPLFLELPPHFPHYQFLLAGAPSLQENDYKKYIEGGEIKLLFGETYSILKHSQASLVCSGTASLEAALLNSPNAICYKVNSLSGLIVKRLIKSRFVGMVNIIFDKEIVKEFLQKNCNKENMVSELKRLLNPRVQMKMRHKFDKLRELLGSSGASEKIAESMIEELTSIIDKTRYTKLYKSPMGTLKLVSDGEYLLEITYISPEELENRSKRQKKQENVRVEVLEEASKQLDEYFAEKRKEFNLPVKLTGTSFQKKVWEELRRIPYGNVRSYGEIASLVHASDASRAVGSACKMNPLLIVVPCHRVLGAHNKLIGFNIGLEKKSYLLDLEKAYVNADTNLFSKSINEDTNDQGGV
jgi:lipid-A-disaccharide synthase